MFSYTPARIITGVQADTGDDPTYQQLLAVLTEYGADFGLIDHDPVGTTEVVSALRGHPVRQAAKCLMLIVKLDRKTKKYVLAVVPGDRKVDLGAIRTLYGARYAGFCETATAERLARAVAGTVLPFALDPEVELVVDPGVLEQPRLYFNAARLDRSVSLATDDYARITQPTVHTISAPIEPADHTWSEPVTARKDYGMHYEPLFKTLELMNVQALIDATTDPWYNQTLIEVGGVLVRLGVMHGEFHWHKHDEQDEFFFVLDGQFHIELDRQDTVTLGPRDGFCVPAGLLHRPVVPVRSAVLMLEKSGVIATGD